MSGNTFLAGVVLAAAVVAAARADEWPVLWPTLPPVVETSASLPDTSSVDDSTAHACETRSSEAEVFSVGGGRTEVVLEDVKSKEELIRADGPSHPWPHMGCLMCLGNHLIGSHGQSTNYLRSITYNQWRILHDNLHNSKEFAGVEGSGEGWIGYEAGGFSHRRRGLLGRLLR
jgi:hypothetical protein